MTTQSLYVILTCFDKGVALLNKNYFGNKPHLSDFNHDLTGLELKK